MIHEDTSGKVTGHSFQGTEQKFSLWNYHSLELSLRVLSVGGIFILGIFHSMELFVLKTVLILC